MDSKKLKIIICAYTLLISTALFGQAWPNSYTLIGNDVPRKTYSKYEVKGIFKGEISSWSNGAAVVIVLPGSKSPFASDFAKNILGMSVQGMQKYWLSLVFQGRANPPVFIDSPSDVVQYVRSNRGAIGLVNSIGLDIPSNLILSVQP